MRRLLVILTIALVLSFLIYPSAFIYSHSTLPDSNDTRLIAYIINQVQLNLINHKSIYYATYFAPYQNTLTYSEPFFLSAILTLPLRLLDSSPISIANSAYILGFFLTFVSSFYFFDYLFKNFYSALLAALLFNLSGFHLTYLPHLQMYSLWPVFLALYFFLHRHYFFFFLAVTTQMAESIFPVYLLFFYVAISLITHPNKVLTAKFLILNYLLFLPLWFYILFPYAIFHYSFPEAVRPIRDAAHFSLGLEEVLTKYHSWTFIILLIISLIKRDKNRKLKIGNYLKIGNCKLIIIFSTIMSLGPIVKIFGHSLKIFGQPIPLPYTLFYYLFPGFNGFRTPSRFIILAALAATIIIVIKLEPFFNKLKSSTKYLFLIIFTLLLLFEARLPRPGYAVNPTPPTVYEAVKKLPPDAVILELPILLWNDPGHEIESLRSLYSLEHGHRRLGGFSGFAPLAWIDLVQRLQTTGSDPVAITLLLKSAGVTHIVKNNTLTPLQ